MRVRFDEPYWLECVWATITGIGLGCLIVWAGYGLVNWLMQL